MKLLSMYCHYGGSGRVNFTRQITVEYLQLLLNTFIERIGERRTSLNRLEQGAKSQK